MHQNQISKLYNLHCYSNYMPFRCRRCGLCCSMAVKLEKPDIEMLKKTGLSLEDFSQDDDKGRLIMRRVNNYCYFLRIEHGVAGCAIYEHRPRRCREYPYGEKCSLIRHFVLHDLLNDVK
ncbi:hypothetical protein COV22_04175 [Candidatus Woesearchaeota archaeon CG10_big_fil_rev_8_21_14_0_10_47_5]|nr:MAG: hypothetical protein AUJ69_00730 [Candidatus Woesearchaeota archaeon CG1_02_47_18]PIN72060.1 MAG: hypothetical protein COV22_04175 [Candidatus Woesearchaeota archaeon CG10_big_fil_rev_8_21_14_0_10_47_5]